MAKYRKKPVVIEAVQFVRCDAPCGKCTHDQGIDKATAQILATVKERVLNKLIKCNNVCDCIPEINKLFEVK